jgi:translation elongation factor EF-4
VLEKDKKTPLDIIIHHRSEDLLELHEKLAAVHREKEQRVNYFKAKVKNLVTEENTRIANENTLAQNAVNQVNSERWTEYTALEKQWRGDFTKAQKQFEVQRQEKLKIRSALRIEVPQRFQSIIDKFLPKKEDNSVKAE